MIISCLLLKTSQLSPEDALDLFAKKRTATNKIIIVMFLKMECHHQNH